METLDQLQNHPIVITIALVVLGLFLIVSNLQQTVAIKKLVSDAVYRVYADAMEDDEFIAISIEYNPHFRLPDHKDDVQAIKMIAACYYAYCVMKAGNGFVNARYPDAYQELAHNEY